MVLMLLLSASCAWAKVEKSENDLDHLEPEASLPAPTSEIPTTENTNAGATVRPTSNVVRAALDDFGFAPELENEIWLNSDQSLRLENLRGKVVLIDMWTFG